LVQTQDTAPWYVRLAEMRRSLPAFMQQPVDRAMNEVRRSFSIAARVLPRREPETAAGARGSQHARRRRSAAAAPLSDRVWQALPEGRALSREQVAELPPIKGTPESQFVTALQQLESVGRVSNVGHGYNKVSAPGIYRHPPGRLSRWGIVDVGLKCTHSCQFCYYANLDDDPDPFHGMRHASFLPPEHVLALARSLAANGFVGFDVTGGEPTLSPGIVTLAHEAQKLGLAMRVITLGQFLGARPKTAGGRLLIEALTEAGVADFLLSVHAVSEAEFAAITGGSWRKLQWAMNWLDDVGFDYCTNTTVHESNFRLLPEIAAEIARHRVYAANLIVMNAYYAWSRPGGRAAQVQGHYGELHPYLQEARDRLEASGIAVNIRYAPLCTVKGMERNLVGVAGVRHDPHEWMNEIQHMSPGDPALMGRRLPLRDWDQGAPLRRGTPHFAEREDKVFPDKCRDCHAINVCDGIDQRYLAERGDDELQPYEAFRGDVLDDERVRYLPAFVCKTAPFADARGAVSQAFAEARVAGANHA
jgi:Radical SAM superfamily